MPDNPTTDLVKTAQSPSLARVSNQLALTDKLLTKPEEPFLIPYRKGNNWGFCDINGKIKIECQYLNAEMFVGGKAKVREWHEELTLNLKGEIVSTKKVIDNDLRLETTDNPNTYNVYLANQLEIYSEAEPDGERLGTLSEGLQAFTEGHKIGFKDAEGNLIIAPIYDDMSEFGDPDLYDLPAYREGLSCVLREDKFGYIDKSGNVKIPFIFSDAVDFQMGLATVSINNKYGCINTKAEFVIPCEFETIAGFSEGLAKASYNGKFGYIDMSGNTVIDFQYVDAGNFSEGLAYVAPDNMYEFGYINKLGEIVIPIVFNRAYNFHNGVAQVGQGQYRSLINKFGKSLLPFKYDFIIAEKQGLAFVWKGAYYNLRKVGYVNIKSGMEYWED